LHVVFLWRRCRLYILLYCILGLIAFDYEVSISKLEGIIMITCHTAIKYFIIEQIMCGCHIASWAKTNYNFVHLNNIFFSFHFRENIGSCVPNIWCHDSYVLLPIKWRKKIKKLSMGSAWQRPINMADGCLWKIYSNKWKSIGGKCKIVHTQSEFWCYTVGV
jgi:hypothetical protein